MAVRRLIVGALICVAVPLAGCGPDGTAQPASSGGASSGAASGGAPAQAGAGSRPADACLAGTWKVDVQDMADQAAALMKSAAGTGVGEGSVTVIFADTLTLRYANTLTLTSGTSGGMQIGIKDSYSGDAVSTDYTAKDGKITGTIPGQTVTKSTSVIVGGQTQPATSGQVAGTLDLSSGFAAYQCEGNRANISNGTITWKLTKA